ncbi:MAG: hypothetical protein HY719_15910 [Planctomycetes bacterium]|nr:hypothetical protein [Planctomycetota bacterium]
MDKQIVMLNSELPAAASGQTPFSSKKLARAYHHLFHLAHQDGERLVFASAYDFDWNGNVTAHWMPYDDDWVPVEETIPIGWVFDKIGDVDPHYVAVINRLLDLKTPVFGHVGLNRFVSDKWGCYETFRDFSPLTWRVEQRPEAIIGQVQDFFEEMDRLYDDHSDLAVLKPVRGWESRGLHIVRRHEDGALSLRHLWGQPLEHPEHVEGALMAMVNTPYIIQAFVEVGGGIPEMGYPYHKHDCRFIFVIDEPGHARFLHSYIKSPDGMLYTDPAEYPPGVFEVVGPIADHVTSRFPYGVFCVDVMRDHSGRWYLTELNDQVGFNIDFEREEDVRGVTSLMQTYLGQLRRMRDNADDPRYRTPI